MFEVKCNKNEAERNENHGNAKIKTFDGDVLDSESKNDRPDHAERHLQISVNNFCTRQTPKRIRLRLLTSQLRVHYKIRICVRTISEDRVV